RQVVRREVADRIDLHSAHTKAGYFLECLAEGKTKRFEVNTDLQTIHGILIGRIATKNTKSHKKKRRPRDSHVAQRTKLTPFTLFCVFLCFSWAFLLPSEGAFVGDEGLSVGEVLDGTDQFAVDGIRQANRAPARAADTQMTAVVLHADGPQQV